MKEKETSRDGMEVEVEVDGRKVLWRSSWNFRKEDW